MPYYKRRPKSYYIKRSIVRWIFWSSAFLGAVFVLSAIANRDTQPPCPISLQPDFTYITKEPFSLDTCDLPYNISINDNGRWWWTE